MVENVINNHLNVKMNITLDICTTLSLDELENTLGCLLMDSDHNKFQADVIKYDVKNVSLCGCSRLDD